MMKINPLTTRFAYTSDLGVKLKVSYRIASKRRRQHFRWMLIINYVDALSMSDGKKEITMSDSNQVSALDIGKNTNWDCLLIKKM